MKESDAGSIAVDGGQSKKELAKLAHGLAGITFDDMGFPLTVQVPDPSKMRNIQTVTRFKVQKGQKSTDDLSLAGLGRKNRRNITVQDFS